VLPLGHCEEKIHKVKFNFQWRCNLKFSSSLVLMLVLVVLVTPVGAQTNAANDPALCSLMTLNGRYGVLEQGTIVKQIPGFPFPPPYPVVLAANATYDGAGNESGTFTTSIGGLVLTGTFTGMYTVAPDCTYTEDFVATPPGVSLHVSGVINGNGIFREILYIYTDPDRVVFGTAKKTPPGGCSLETLKGKYANLGNSTVVAAPPGFPPTPFPTAEFVILTYDGAGNASGTFTINFDGMVFSGTGTSTYTVNRDCSYSQATTLPDGSVEHATGTITGEGIHQEVRFISTGSGQVSSGTMKKM